MIRRLLVLALLLSPTVTYAQAKKGGGHERGQVSLGRFLEQRQFAEGLAWLDSFGDGSREQQRYRGLFHHGLFQPDATLKDLLPIYRASPTDDTVALAVAEACLWKKDYKTATTVLAALKAPDEPEALRVRALLYEQAGRLPEALQLYERAIPGLKLPWGAMERQGQVLSWLKRFDEAQTVYDAIIRSKVASQPQRLRCRVRRAELAAWRKDFDGALAQLAKLLQEAPRLTDALMLKGQILEWQGKYREAKQAYSSVLAADSNHAEARLRLNKLLWVK
jgi:tetratricopeptide (TPR) repeat protein